jgi:hypothetical protein
MFVSVEKIFSNYNCKIAQRRLSKGKEMRKISSPVIVWMIKFLLLEICYGQAHFRFQKIES